MLTAVEQNLAHIAAVNYLSSNSFDDYLNLYNDRLTTDQVTKTVNQNLNLLVEWIDSLIEGLNSGKDGSQLTDDISINYRDKAQADLKDCYERNNAEIKAQFTSPEQRKILIANMVARVTRINYNNELDLLNKPGTAKFINEIDLPKELFDLVKMILRKVSLSILTRCFDGTAEDDDSDAAALAVYFAKATSTGYGICRIKDDVHDELIEEIKSTEDHFDDDSKSVNAALMSLWQIENRDKTINELNPVLGNISKFSNINPGAALSYISKFGEIELTNGLYEIIRECFGLFTEDVDEQQIVEDDDEDQEINLFEYDPDLVMLQILAKLNPEGYQKLQEDQELQEAMLHLLENDNMAIKTYAAIVLGKIGKLNTEDIEVDLQKMFRDLYSAEDPLVQCLSYELLKIYIHNDESSEIIARLIDENQEELLMSGNLSKLFLTISLVAERAKATQDFSSLIGFASLSQNAIYPEMIDNEMSSNKGKLKLKTLAKTFAIAGLIYAGYPFKQNPNLAKDRADFINLISSDLFIDRDIQYIYYYAEMMGARSNLAINNFTKRLKNIDFRRFPKEKAQVASTLLAEILRNSANIDKYLDIDFYSDQYQSTFMIDRYINSLPVMVTSPVSDINEMFYQQISGNLNDDYMDNYISRMHNNFSAAMRQTDSKQQAKAIRRIMELYNNTRDKDIDNGQTTRLDIENSCYNSLSYIARDNPYKLLEYVKGGELYDENLPSSRLAEEVFYNLAA